MGYLRDAKRELTKVSWPTRAQTIRQSLLVMGVMIAALVFLGGLDWLLNLALQKVL